jgi:photosystem II stability/assembly factor-like uncharacterized protein
MGREENKGVVTLLSHRPTGIRPTDREVLNREARRLRRQHWAIGVATSVAIAVAISLTVFADGSSPASNHARIPGGGEPPSGSGGPSRQSGSSSAVAIDNAMQSFIVDVAGSKSIIVENWSGIFVSIDAGDRWTRILDADGSTLTHIEGIVSLGTKDIWLREIGDTRYDFVPYSRDGGATWETGRLPGGANNPSSIAFANPDDGTLTAAEASLNGGGTARFETTNGGRTWVRTASTTAIRAPKPPRPAPVAGGKVPEGLRIQQTYYASFGLSWALAASSSGSTYLLRSTDGGRQWALVPESAAPGRDA